MGKAATLETIFDELHGPGEHSGSGGRTWGMRAHVSEDLWEPETDDCKSFFKKGVSMRGK